MPKARYTRDARIRASKLRHAKPPSSLQALQDAVVTTPRRVSDADAHVAKRLQALGVFPEDIARVMGTSDQAMARALRREEASQVLFDNAVRLAQDWLRAATVAADEGNHVPAMDALRAIQAVEKPEERAGRGGGITVNVGVALPGTPGAPLLPTVGA
jgi:hypothetical protein